MTLSDEIKQVRHRFGKGGLIIDELFRELIDVDLKDSRALRTVCAKGRTLKKVPNWSWKPMTTVCISLACSRP
jgi:hypothetical protein